MEKYFVVENRNIGTIGNPKFVKTILFSGTKEECAAYEDLKRKEYKDRTVGDCFTQSESEMNKIILVDKFWEGLTEEQKKKQLW